MDKMTEDALQLCDKAIRTKEKNELFKKGLREISIEPVKTHEFQIGWDEEVIIYNYDSTPIRLQKEDVLSETWIPNINASYKNTFRGYMQVYINYKNAKKWIDKTVKESLIPIKPRAVIPEGQFYVYDKTNSEFRMFLHDGSIATVDFSTAKLAKSCFESLYELHRRRKNTYFSRNEIQSVYKELNGEGLDWNKFTDAVKHINQKFQNKHIEEQATLRYDRKQGKYLFELTPAPPVG